MLLYDIFYYRADGSRLKHFDSKTSARKVQPDKGGFACAVCINWTSQTIWFNDYGEECLPPFAETGLRPNSLTTQQGTGGGRRVLRKSENLS
jgi:hypothetical protein